MQTFTLNPRTQVIVSLLGQRERERERRLIGDAHVKMYSLLEIGYAIKH